MNTEDKKDLKHWGVLGMHWGVSSGGGSGGVSGAIRRSAAKANAKDVASLRKHGFTKEADAVAGNMKGGGSSKKPTAHLVLSKKHYEALAATKEKRFSELAGNKTKKERGKKLVNAALAGGLTLLTVHALLKVATRLA